MGRRGSDHSREVLAMADGLHHRGPDAGGSWNSPEHGVFLGHRRLSIIDLSERANQPMLSDDGRLALVYNGEIYNFVELRRELSARGCRFRTTSDTEVILHAYDQWGCEGFGKFRGMFAFALYDKVMDKIILARDPLGIKPLYYMQEDETLSFASEARVLWRHAPGNESLAVSDEQAVKIIAHGYLPDSHESLVKGIRKVPPGTYIKFDRFGSSSGRYWMLKADPEWRGFSFDLACERFESVFKDSMRMMLRSDVPLSFLLSGGIDSSYVVALAAKLGMQDIRTFTAVFGDPLDEGVYARQVAGKFGTKHEEFRIETRNIADEFRAVMPYYDDLSSTDSGLFTTALVSRQVAARGIKVAFVGEGSDEILGGYSWFGLGQLPFSLLPANLRALGYYYATSRMVGSRYWSNAARVEAQFKESGERDILRQVSWAEINMQLPNNLLQKVDRATMSASVEARVPFMDHEVVTAAYSLPAAWKRRGRWFRFGAVQEKVILRTLGQERLPPGIAWRKKRGFMLPVAGTLTGNRDFVKDTLLSDGSMALGFFTKKEIERLTGFRRTMYHPTEKQKECLVWRLLLLSLWKKLCWAR